MESLLVCESIGIRESLNDFLKVAPKEETSKIFAIFSSFLKSLKEASELPRSLWFRVFYIQCTLDKVLKAPELEGHNGDMISTMIRQISHLKSLLQLEAISAGMLKVLFQERYYFLQDKSLEYCRALFGDGNLRVYDVDKPEERTAMLEGMKDPELGFKSFVDGLREINVGELSENFDRDLLKLLEGYKIYKHSIEIVDPESEYVTQRYLTSEDPIIRAVAELLFCQHRNKRHVKENATLIDTCPKVLKYLKELDSPSILARKAFLPTLAKLIALKNSCELEGKEFNREILGRPFLEQIVPSLDNELMVWNAEAYELLIKIQDKWREIFDRKFPKRPQQISLDTDLLNAEKGQLVTQLGDAINERIRRNKEPFSFPVHSGFPLCRGKLEFLTLCDPGEIFKKANYQTKSTRSEKRSEGSTACGAGSGACGAGSGACGAGSGLRSGEGVVVSSEEYEAEAAREVVILDERTSVLEGIRVAPRVRAWQTSAEEGLAFYAAARPTGEGLLDEEMILRHRLPLDLVELLLDPAYSKKGAWNSPTGEIHDHFKGLLYIDTKKFVLEVTFDRDNILYHFYARELRNISDYAMSLNAPFEFPPLGASCGPDINTPLVRMIEPSIDEMGSFHIDFDGRHYRLLKLS
jgi:hypothetical protein